MDLKKHKNHIATGLFLACLLLAVYMTIGIINDIGSSIKQKNFDDVTTEVIELHSTDLDLTLPLWADVSWKLVNLVWSLFLGGLLYGKIER